MEKIMTCNKLRTACREAFRDLKAVNDKNYPDRYGFELFYSPEMSCRDDAGILFLTVNPKADNGERVIPEAPWPERHAFWQEKNFRIKRPLQDFHKALNQVLGADPVMAAYSRPGDDEKFVSESVVAASLVPFRTRSEKEISGDMREYSEAMWKKLLEVWEPRLILALGKSPYAFMKRFLRAEKGYVDEPEQSGPTLPLPRGLRNTWIRFSRPGSPPVILGYMPHFARFQPFPQKYAWQDLPTIQFLRQLCRAGNG
jgi:hypothetical protein